MIPQNMLATKHGGALDLTFHVEHPRCGVGIPLPNRCSWIMLAGSCLTSELPPGQHPQKLFSDAEAGENLAEEVIGGKFSCNAG